MSDVDEKKPNAGREEYFIPRLRTMRLLNGWSIAKMAQQAGVDWATIDKIEKHKGVYDYIAAKVHSAVSANLGPAYKNPSKEITNSRRPLR